MVELSDVEAGLLYLSQTDEQFGLSKARMLACKERLKVTLAVAYLEVKDGSVRSRDAQALVSLQDRRQLEEYEDSIAEYETIRAKRLRYELTIEVWRSLNSARSKGVMT